MTRPFRGTPQFLEELEWWRDNDIDTARRVVALVEQVLDTPRRGIGKPKRLAGLPGVWSRRVTRFDRLYYEIEDGEVVFLQCRGHDLPQHFYDEKRHEMRSAE